MQNYKKYIGYFTCSPIMPADQTTAFINALGKFNKRINHYPLPDDRLCHLIWRMPEDKPMRDDYYDLFYIMAKYIGVKLMWRDLLGYDDHKVIHGLLVIGPSVRVELWTHIMTIFFEGYFEYHKWLKYNKIDEAKGKGYQDIRTYSRVLLRLQIDTIVTYLKDKLAMPVAYWLRLENWIKEAYKLDYKKYNTDHHEYYHAISTKFQNKRMLL